MKIIKRGEIPVDVLHATCNYCGTIFEAEKGEYRYSARHEDHSIHDSDAYKTICPVCNRTVYVSIGREADWILPKYIKTKDYVFVNGALKEKVTDNKTFNCKICGKVFKNSEAQLAWFDEGLCKSVCPDCGKIAIGEDK